MNRDIIFEAEGFGESRFTTYFSTIEEEDHVKIYYRSIPKSITRDCTQLYENQYSSLAIWKNQIIARPKLNLNCSDKKLKTNNFIFSGHKSHNFFAFKDPNHLHQSKYKGIYRDVHKSQTCLILLGSNDGITWGKIAPIIYPDMILPDFRPNHGAFDTLNHITYNGKYYRIFARHNISHGQRIIQTATSTDLLSWSTFETCQINKNINYNVYTPCVKYIHKIGYIGLFNFLKSNDHQSKRISICHSSNGINWNKIEINPNLNLGNFSQTGVNFIKLQNNNLHIWINHFSSAQISQLTIPNFTSLLPHP